MAQGHLLHSRVAFCFSNLLILEGQGLWLGGSYLSQMRAGTELTHSGLRQKEKIYNEEVTNGPSHASHLNIKALWPLPPTLQRECVLFID